ncbi:MAG: bifunctional phosphoribosylaminoimidazolecarboxamide formyltransferase/IMP cyclohydrolase [Bacteroidia bacterium]|nr:bifunctional phosphoribosylaminoimidazolecarboxamide formyltransferase/IMP cyclohydrolase [Bacteroidia bacterium]
MTAKKAIRSALISVYHKEGLEEVAKELIARNVIIYSTGGTAAYLESLGAKVEEVADLTGYPSILGGRVKTLHPKVHGGILARRSEEGDVKTLAEFDIPPIDLVVVDLYPFEETVASGAEDAAIIEKIDIGGIALIRAAAKNFTDVTCIASEEEYSELAKLLREQNGEISLEQRKTFAARAFDVSSHYDTQIHAYLDPESPNLKLSLQKPKQLRYGENPHQKGYFLGNLSKVFEQLNGKELSYNNLVDIEGALQLVDEFEEPFFAIIKHTNPCGCALGNDMKEAWHRALEGDPVSAFGGILACNGKIDKELAEDINKLFYEVLIAEEFTEEALEVLRSKKKRIVLKRLSKEMHPQIVKSAINGYLVQDKDHKKADESILEVKTSRQPSREEISDVVFGDLVCKHLKSNAIALVKNGQLIGSGIGQTSRIDALKQAIQKAEVRGFELSGSVLASDAFFPFADSVELAHQKGIEIVVEPGGSVRDEDTINFCESHGMCLIFTGIRHFKH